MRAETLHAPPRRAGLAAALLFAVVLAGCASVQSRPPVTVEQIVQMSKEGVPAADIVQKMRDAGTVYRLSGSQLARLKGEGVSDEVLDYMQQTLLAQERARGAMDYAPYWGGPYWYGPGPFWGPYPYWGPYWGPYPYYHHYHPRGTPPPHPAGARALAPGHPAPPAPPTAGPHLP
jgi:hypothetical protein